MNTNLSFQEFKTKRHFLKNDSLLKTLKTCFLFREKTVMGNDQTLPTLHPACSRSDLHIFDISTKNLKNNESISNMKIFEKKT